MNVDWAVAISVFTMFVIWSVVYYIGFSSPTGDLSQGLEAQSLRIMGFLETQEFSVPVSYGSPSSGQAVLYAEFPVDPEHEDGLKVLDGSTSLSCMLQGSRLYWEADLSAGDNLFEILYSDAGTSGCTDTLSTSGANQTFPLAAVQTPRISQSTLSALSGVPYENFRSSLAIRNQVRLEWSGVAQGTYGPEPPPNVDVSVSESSRLYLEGSGDVDVRMLFWE